MVIGMKYCDIIWTPEGCVTRFPDGAEVEAHPHPEMPHYHVISHRCGYGDDVMRYCREHELAHIFVSERLMNAPSYVLSTLAHGEKQDLGIVLYEEMAAQQMQRWVRANERPILSGANWDNLKRDFLSLLGE